MNQLHKFPKNDYYTGMWLAVLGVIILSPDSLLIRLISVDSWTLLFWRGFLSSLAFAVFLFLTRRLTAHQLICGVGFYGICVAILMAGSSVLFVHSIRLTAVSNTLVILSAAPLFAGVMSRVFLNEHIATRTWYGVVIVVVGMAVIFSGGLTTGRFLGDVCALGTAFTFAATFVVLRRARNINILPTIMLMGLLISASVAPLASPFSIDLSSFVYLLLLGLLVLPIAYSLLFLAPRYLPAPDIALVTMLEALLGPFWVWLVFTEIPTTETFLGGFLILGTLVTLTLLGVSHRDQP